MRGIINHIKETHSVYPGEYKPLPFDIRRVKAEVGKLHEGASRVAVNIIECADHYKIEIVAPGHSKDDFIVTVDKGRIYVFAAGRISKRRKPPFYLSHAFNYDYFEHEIPLPKDIDTDFLRAEYKEGILSVCFPKTDKPVLSTIHDVVVY
ncbi:MAG: Hsp20/alpha crystallin family protein [Bacteroidota bacterium]|nr:Hsp20/alpha crystallin family protein [Bacteroidota bacterium]